MILEGLGTEEQERRFWAKVGESTGEGCMEWTGAKDPAGYGRFGIGMRSTLAHRAAYWLATGEDPGRWVVMHTCDNPPCVNPRHLRLGTHGMNCADKITKGRYAARAHLGSANGKAVLTDEQVIEIQAALIAGESGASIARRYAISQSLVSKVKYGRRPMSGTRRIGAVA